MMVDSDSLVDLVLEHIHAYDLASAFYALAQWQRLKVVTRAKANEMAGAPLPPCRPAAIPADGESSAPSKWDNEEVEGLAKREKTVTVPLFNVSDGSGQTQEEAAKVLEKVIGIKIDFLSAITNAMAKVSFLPSSPYRMRLTSSILCR